MATALSRMERIVGPIIDKVADIEDILIRALPMRDISRCPATILAVNRTHNVIGRIKFLISSIATMKFISSTGVPCGSMWESMCLVFFVHPFNIIAIHSVKERGRVITRWADTEKICGYSAKKLMVMIVPIVIRIIKLSPFFGFVKL